jgi:hypothetical protein
MLALAAKQNATLWGGVMLDPFDPAATREELVNGFLSPRRFGLGQQHATALPFDHPQYVLPFTSVAAIAHKAQQRASVFNLCDRDHPYLPVIGRMGTSPTSIGPTAVQVRYPRPFPTYALL